MAARRSAAVLLGAGVLLGACAGGHGKYTTEAKLEAKSRMDKIRAATEYDLAKQQFDGGDLKRALETINRCVALNPDVAPGHLLRGRILLESGHAAGALAAFDRGAGLAPEVPDFHYYRGIVLERMGRQEDALASFRQAAVLDPASGHYLLAQAETLVELGRLDEARTLLEEQSDEFRLTAGFRQTLGHVALMRGEVGDAVKFFSEAVVLAPEDLVLREDLARAQIAAATFAAAESNLQRILEDKRYAERRDLQHLQASCLLELDRPVEARGLLNRLVEGSGVNDVQAWVKLADVAIVLGDDGMLRHVSQRLIAVAPERHEGYLTLALWQRRTGDLDGALKSAGMARERAGEDPTAAHLERLIQRDVEQRGLSAGS